MDRRQKLEEICQEYAVQDLYVFGSRAREVKNWVEGVLSFLDLKGSDVDIGILPCELISWTPDKKVDFSMEIEDFLGVDRVDLVLLPEAEPFLALDVIRGELLYSQDLDLQARYELFVLRRAGDLLPFKKDRIRMIMEEGGR